jgi:hypothetical protein
MAPSGSAITRLSEQLTRKIGATYPGLAWLDLSNNRVERLENLAPLRSLSGLDLSFNALAELRLGDVAALPALATLVLANNAVERVAGPGPGESAPPLVALDLACNAIRSVSALAGIGALVRARLRCE